MKKDANTINSQLV